MFETQAVTMTASSELSATTSAADSIISSGAASGSGYWQPSSNNYNQWLQADFLSDVQVYKFMFMRSGLSTSNNGVERLKLQITSTDEWTTVTNPRSNAGGQV